MGVAQSSWRDSPPSRRQRGQASTEEIAIAALHQLPALRNEPTCSIFEELAHTVPFLRHVYFAEDRNRNLAIGLPGQCPVERDQGVPEALIIGKGRALDGGGILPEAL